MKVWSIMLLLLMVMPVSAHQPSTAFLELSENRSQATLQWALTDLQRAVGVDHNRDGQLLWSEVVQAETAIESYIRESLTLSSQDQVCNVQLNGPLLLNPRSEGGYLVMPLQLVCKSHRAADTLFYQGMFGLSPQHKLLLSNTRDDSVQMLDHATSVSLTETRTKLATLMEFVKQGVIHIWIGIDHLAFLLTLMLVTMVKRENHQWHARSGRQALRSAALLVSVFTLAHSVTLILVSTGMLRLPVYWVELAIAVTVVLAALNNLWPLIRQVSLMVFVFGLIHGFGFAAVLSELMQNSSSIAAALAGFNIGVELGQLAVVLSILPLLLLISRYPWYGRVVLPGLSALMALAGLFWVANRI